MDISKIIENILLILDKNSEEPISPRSGVKFGTLIRLLITKSSIKEASVELGKSDSALENLIRRNLLPICVDKVRGISWDNYLLGLCNLKKCSKCVEYKDLSLFYKNEDRKSSWCKACCDVRTGVSRPFHRVENRLRSKKHYLNNKHDYIYKSSKRRRVLYQATPPWADLSKIKEIYATCPEGWHVDHDIPLQGELVCGLHVETNLIPMPAEMNLAKGNKFLVD